MESYGKPRFSDINETSMEVINAYPNPSTDMVTIQYERQFNYEITSIDGKLVMTGNAVDQEQISMIDFADGTYIVKVTAGDEINFVQVVKQ